jgi:hypothetical protein
MAGDAETPNLPDIFVSPRGILDSGNYPGSRAYGASFMDNQGLMNMFGRMSNDNVLWKLGFGHEYLFAEILSMKFVLDMENVSTGINVHVMKVTLEQNANLWVH